MEIVDILKAARELGASDVHLSAGRRPVARVAGELLDMEGLPALDAEDCKVLAYSILRDEQRGRLEAELAVDASFAVAELGRFRVNVFHALGGVEAVFRLIPPAIPSAEFIGLGPNALKVTDLRRGLVLVTGPTGSGKSTTLACLIQEICGRHRRHVITVEDPVEFVFQPKGSLVRQREVGSDARGFADALRHALREDPDVILVGEMRDLETAALALSAAETGHLCLSTLHTIDAAQTVDRVVDMFPARQQGQVRGQLAGCLEAVFSQTLVARAEGKERVAARGVMRVTPAIANLIREGKTHMIPSAIETGANAGMLSVDRALGDLVRRDVVTLQEALSHAHDAQRMMEAANRRRPVAA